MASWTVIFSIIFTKSWFSNSIFCGDFIINLSSVQETSLYNFQKIIIFLLVISDVSRAMFDNALNPNNLLEACNQKRIFFKIQ